MIDKGVLGCRLTGTLYHRVKIGLRDVCPTEQVHRQLTYHPDIIITQSPKTNGKAGPHHHKEEEKQRCGQSEMTSCNSTGEWRSFLIKQRRYWNISFYINKKLVNLIPTYQYNLPHSYIFFTRLNFSSNQVAVLEDKVTPILTHSHTLMAALNSSAKMELLLQLMKVSTNILIVPWENK